MTIRFGTSGWRGVLADDFTFAGARAVSAAVARWVSQSGPRPRVIVAHDHRFLGDLFAGAAARVLAAAGIRPIRADGPVPTPVASFAVRQRRAAAGMIFTASHNPPQYQGLKIVAPWGGGATEEITRKLEQWATEVLASGPPPELEPRGARVELVSPYLDRLLEQLDQAALRRSRIRVFYDALHGVGAGVLDEALRRCGLAVEVRRGDRDPRLGGQSPDPAPERLIPLAREVRRHRGLRLGLATDGDADRFGVIDADGRSLSESAALALLVDHLARTGRVRRGLAISIATGSLVERVARAHGLAVRRFPIGFKHLSRALVDGVADVAGEESGGFAWGRIARDKDGMLAGCLLAEIVATTGAPLRARLDELEREHGRSACGRMALAGLPGVSEGLSALGRTLPARVDGAQILTCDERDGLRLELADGFLMFRESGTEPVVRVYAEAPGPRLLSRRLRVGAQLLRRAARQTPAGLALGS
jgi:phosphomannomutase